MTNFAIFMLCIFAIVAGPLLNTVCRCVKRSGETDHHDEARLAEAEGS